MRKRKSAMAVSIIGGADGPTSVFLAGKLKGDDAKKEKHISYCQKRKLNKRNKELEKMKKKLRKMGISSHTVEELEEYLCTKYKAVKIGEDTEDYKRALKSTKTNLIFHFYKDLLPEHPALSEKPSPEALEEYNEKIQAWFKEVEEIEIPEEEICFHYYKIEVLNGKSKGQILLELELKHQAFFVSSYYSDSNQALFRKMKKIVKEIYLYYGVMEEDMQENSERFMMLNAVLQPDHGLGKHKKKGKKRKWLWRAGFLFSVISLIKWLRKKKICLLKKI